MNEQKHFTFWMIGMAVIAFGMLVAAVFINEAQAAEDPLVGLYGQVVSQNAAQLKLERLKGNPRAYLQWYSTKQGLEQWEIDKLDYIMWKESKWCHPDQLQNAVSTAAGCMGIIRGTWLANSEYPWSDRYVNYKNIQTALIIYQRSGFGPWSASL